MAIGGQPPAPPSPGTATKTVRILGEVLITAGLVVLLFVVYELSVTDLLSGRKQVAAARALDEEWAGGRPQLQRQPIDDKAFAKLSIPALGADYHYTVQEGVAADGGPYGRTPGREIVSPSQGDVVAPVPHRPADVLPKSGQVALLTLTTPHPRFSDRQRLIVHAVLTNQFAKTPGAGYPQLLKAIGEAG